MKSPEYYFKQGADAMQAKIVAILVTKGYMKIAPKVLAITTPTFIESEEITLNKQNGIGE